MKKRYLWPGILTLLASVLFTASCGISDGDIGTVELQRSWELDSLYGADAREIPLSDSELHVLRFTGKNTFNGQTACNEYGGRYRAEADGAFVVHELASTDELCQDPNHSSRFLQGLSAATRFEWDQGQLTLHYGESGRLVFLERLEIQPG